MAKSMSPVFTKLMNLLLALRPSSVPDYLVTAVESFIETKEFADIGVEKTAKADAKVEVAEPQTAAAAVTTTTATVDTTVVKVSRADTAQQMMNKLVADW